MPKMKTHRGAAKRFKATASGKIKRSKSLSQHILTSNTKMCGTENYKSSHIKTSNSNNI